jgi:hypothetical protein
MDDVGICIPFFAAAEAPRRNANLRRTLQALRHCNPKQIIVVECDMGHVCTKDLTVSHIVNGDVLWQKERLMQIGCEILIERGYQKLVCMDGDCILDNVQWLKKASAKLTNNRAVQCFNYFESVGDERTLRGTGSIAELQCKKRIKRVASGGIWGYRAEIIKSPGLFQHCIVGAGDVAQFVGMVAPNELMKVYRMWGYPKVFHDVMRAWVTLWHKAVDRRYDCINATARFQPHGRRDARNCGGRHALLRDFNPAWLVAQPGQGLCWQDDNVELHRRVAAYARKRSA